MFLRERINTASKIKNYIYSHREWEMDIRKDSDYSTVTDFAKLRGLSTSVPRA